MMCTLHRPERRGEVSCVQLNRVSATVSVHAFATAAGQGQAQLAQVLRQLLACLVVTWRGPDHTLTP